MRINQNISAFNAYRNLSNTNTAMGKSLEKLSSGFRINRAADDASGLVRSEGLRSEIGGTKVAIRNAQDGISFVQTAEGALNEVHSILQRMRDLAVSAANGTSDGTAEKAEFDELKAELTAIGSRTTFAGDDVFGDYSGTGDAKNFHVGAGQSDVLAVDANLKIAVDGSETEGVLGSADLDGVGLASDASAQAAIATLDDAIAATSRRRGRTWVRRRTGWSRLCATSRSRRRTCRRRSRGSVTPTWPRRW